MAFSTIAFTTSVRAAQERYGTREQNAGFDQLPETADRISAAVRRFIEGIDTMFMATVGDDGWPYVQHRGGPAGFIKVLDDSTVAFADYAGNRQYISTGNLDGNNRVALILMDFARRRRLKIWGRVSIVHADTDPATMAMLDVPAYPASVERGYVIKVEALDFNCPQHITRRFTEAEIAASHAPLYDELQVLRELATKAPAR